MRDLLARFRGTDGSACRCAPTFEGDDLRVDAGDCPESGGLAASPDCRATVVEALADRDAERVVVRAAGIERAYEGRGAATLLAAGRFADRAAFHDRRLARLARRDPLRAAREATGRAGPVSDIAAETALAECARSVDGYDDLLRPFVGPTVARSRVAARPPEGAAFDADRPLDGGATARIYSVPGEELRRYHLEPSESTLGPEAYATLSRAHDLLATAGVTGGDRAPGRAVRRAAGDDAPVEALSGILRKHTRGYGAVEDLFADPGVSDVFATAPAADNRLRVVVDGEPMRTNVRLTGAGVRSLASRFRRTSGRAFSRASPTLDAVADLGSETGGNERRVRVAGVTEPASDGLAFAFRSHDPEPWTLPALVANDTLSAPAAALLSVAVERSAAGLVAGTRGAGKTTMLGALLWELSAGTRTVLIEDTSELPVDALQREGRDVQAIRTASGDGSGLPPAEALRTALRLGEGALVLGEVRGEEARVLYEAMRVGASGSAVLGTIHGDGAAAVRERVVSDLGVAPSAFGTTDLVVTLGADRYANAIEEVVGRGADVRFEPLYERDGDDLAATGRIARGNSHLVDALAGPGESYADVRSALADRTELFRTLARRDRTAAADVVRAHAERRGGDRGGDAGREPGSDRGRCGDR